MFSLTTSRRAIALAVVFALAACPVLAANPSPAAEPFSGRVVQGTPPEPRGGVVVSLVGEPDGALWSSEPTGPDGSFRVEGAPDGGYAVVVHDGETAYLAAERVELPGAGQRAVTLAITPGLAPAQSGGPNQGELPRWAQWVIAGGVVVIGGYLVSETLSSDDENPASPF